MDAKFTVTDMTCNHCVQTITNAAKSIDPNAILDINLEQHSLMISTGKDNINEIEQAIRNEGYDISPVA